MLTSIQPLKGRVLGEWSGLHLNPFGSHCGPPGDSLGCLFAGQLSENNIGYYDATIQAPEDAHSVDKNEVIEG